MKNRNSLLVLLLIVMLTSGFPTAAESADTGDVLVSGDYAYILNPDNTACITEYKGDNTRVVVPEQLDGHTVTGIGERAFYLNTGLISVSLPERLTSIGEGAFTYCRSLTSITLPEGLTSIRESAFLFCKSLTAITLPEGLTSIGEGAFEWCDSLQSINLPDTLSAVDGNPFGRTPVRINVSPRNAALATIDGVLFHKQDKSLISYPYYRPDTAYAVPNGIRVIGNNAFSFCQSLTSVTLPEGLTSIGERAFSFCDSLTAITLPEGLTSIGERAFQWCDSLQSINLPDTLSAVDGNPFGRTPVRINVSPRNAALATIDGVFFHKDEKRLITYPYYSTDTAYAVPDGIRVIGNSAFSFCESLTSITLPEGLISIGDAVFFTCRSLTSITVPDGLTSIGEGAFSSCDSLTSITLPEGLTSIGDRAFYSCASLTSITVPEGLTSIGDDAFYSCDRLTSVTLPASLVDIGKAVFRYSPLVTLTVPEGSHAEMWAIENKVPYLYPNSLDWLNE